MARDNLELNFRLLLYWRPLCNLLRIAYKNYDVYVILVNFLNVIQMLKSKVGYQKNPAVISIENSSIPLLLFEQYNICILLVSIHRAIFLGFT